MTRYYVYTCYDGNENGLMKDFTTLDEAKNVATVVYEMLVKSGEPDTRVYVMEVESDNHVWEIGNLN